MGNSVIIIPSLKGIKQEHETLFLLFSVRGCCLKYALNLVSFEMEVLTIPVLYSKLKPSENYMDIKKLITYRIICSYIPQL
jgi:hypothetical protein